MVKTEIQLTEKQARKLRLIASAENKSLNEIIRQAVDRFVASKAGIVREDKRARAIAVARGFCSGYKNVSGENGEHLTEVSGN